MTTIISKKVYFGLIDEELSDESHTSRIVDYKWLANQCSVHVDQAKEMLFEYSQEHPQVHVTYLIAGQLKQQPNLPSFSLQLVSGDKLEQVKQHEFDQIVSLHIHSLSKSRPSTISDLYRSSSNDFSYGKCGAIKHSGPIEMKSKIKHMEIVKPALPPIMETKPSIKKSPKKEEKPSSSAGKISFPSSSAAKKTSSPSPKKSTTPIKQESKAMVDDEDVKKKKQHDDENDELVLDEESDQEMQDAVEEETAEIKQQTKKKSSKTTTTKSSDKKKSSNKGSAAAASVNTLDKFTSKSPVKSSTATSGAGTGERPTKRVKQMVSVKNEKGYLVSKEVWTEVPLTDEEIKQQQAAAMKKVKKELSDDEQDEADQDEVMKDDNETATTGSKKKVPETTKKTVVKASSNNGTKQQSISSFFKKK